MIVWEYGRNERRMSKNKKEKIEECLYMKRGLSVRVRTQTGICEEFGYERVR